MLAGHEVAFGVGTSTPRHSRHAKMDLNGLWRLRLTTGESSDERRRLLDVLTLPQYATLVQRAGG